MSLPVVITTERLTLPLWTADDLAAMRSQRRLPTWHRDFPRRDDLDAATMWSEGDAWGPRSIVRGGTVLGSLGFFGPPDGDPLEAEVGYGLVEEARGWGFATEALRAALACADAAGVRVRASTLPDNKPSMRVLAKCGFTELRGADDQGHLVMARPVPGAVPETSVRDRLRREVTGAMTARDRAAMATFRSALAAIEDAETDRRELDETQTAAIVRSELDELLAAAEVAPEARAEELRAAAEMLRRILGE